MSTTNRLPDDLETRVARADFNAVADWRYAEIVATGKTIAWADMRRYLEARVAGKPARRPVAKKPR